MFVELLHVLQSPGHKTYFFSGTDSSGTQQDQLSQRWLSLLALYHYSDFQPQTLFWKCVWGQRDLKREQGGGRSKARPLSPPGVFRSFPPPPSGPSSASSSAPSRPMPLLFSCCEALQSHIIGMLQDFAFCCCDKNTGKNQLGLWCCYCLL